MDQNTSSPRAPGLMASLKGGAGFVARLMIGAVVIFAASLAAMITAFAGLMLAGAALMLRYTSVRQPVPVRIKDAPVTLQARRTPRGWTVE